MRYRLLHTAARITRSARRTWLRLPNGWRAAIALARPTSRARPQAMELIILSNSAKVPRAS